MYTEFKDNNSCKSCCISEEESKLRENQNINYIYSRNKVDDNNLDLMNHKITRGIKNFDRTNLAIQSDINNMENISTDMYEYDFQNYIAPHMNDNIYSNEIPVSIPFDEDINDNIFIGSSRNSLLAPLSEQQTINNPSDFISQLPGLISSILCCIITLIILYQLFKLKLF